MHACSLAMKTDSAGGLFGWAEASKCLQSSSSFLRVLAVVDVLLELPPPRMYLTTAPTRPLSLSSNTDTFDASAMSSATRAKALFPAVKAAPLQGFSAMVVSLAEISRSSSRSFVVAPDPSSAKCAARKRSACCWTFSMKRPFGSLRMRWSSATLV